MIHLTTVLLVALTYLTPTRDGPMGKCDPIGGPRLAWTKADKAETRARVRAVCRDRGASAEVCNYLSVVVCRESFCGQASIRHTRGAGQQGLGENGLGPMGLGVRTMRHLWPGDDEDPMFCRPEVSALVALELIRRAVKPAKPHMGGGWGATNLIGVQAIYAGHFGSWVDDRGVRYKAPGRTLDPGLCERLSKTRLPSGKSASCWSPLAPGDVGRRVPSSRRRAMALDLAARFDARKATRRRPN